MTELHEKLFDGQGCLATAKRVESEARIEGVQMILNSKEYKQMKKNAEAWELLIGRINDQCEKTEDGPTKEMVYELWNEINNDR